MVLHAHISPGDEQQARWWPQFRDIVSPHRYDHDDDNLQLQVLLVIYVFEKSDFISNAFNYFRHISIKALHLMRTA
jgi:hypothetical protein